MRSFVTHLESALDGTHLPANAIQTTHKDRPLWVRYDLPAVADAISKEQVARRAPTIWRYRELLPLAAVQSEIALGEGMSPLLPCPLLGEQLGIDQLWIKDESQLPTGSFTVRRSSWSMG